MSSVNLAWAADGNIDSYNIYRSSSPMNVSSLPPALATGITAKSYSDTTVASMLKYYYRVGSVKSGAEKVSSEIKCITDPNYAKTDLLIIADSSQITDLSANNRTITVIGNVQYVNSTVNTPLYANGSYYFDGDGDGLLVDLSTFGTSDFTIEICAKFLTPIDTDGWCRYFDLGDSTPSHAFSVSNYGTNNPQSPIMYAYNTLNDWTLFISQNKTFSFNTYTHICLMRKAGVFYLFVNGALSGSNSANTSLNITKHKLCIGTDLANLNRSTPRSESKMYLDSFRVVLDSIYATTGFTPPTSKFIY